MTIKIALLKSGEQVIADIKELVDENDKLVRFVFTNPYVVDFLTSEFLNEEYLQEQQEISHKVGFTPWMPLTSDQSIVVAVDWIVSIVEPIDFVKESYESKMNKSTEGFVNNDLPIAPTEFDSVEVLTEESNG